MENNEGVWILTRENADYNNYGDYFEAIFKEKPTVDNLTDFFKERNRLDKFDGIEHLLSGGRWKFEDQWFTLEFVRFQN